MSLSPEAIEEFQAIYREECGEELSDTKAVELATSFFNLMRVIYRPIPPEIHKQYLVQELVELLRIRLWNLQNRQPSTMP